MIVDIGYREIAVLSRGDVEIEDLLAASRANPPVELPATLPSGVVGNCSSRAFRGFRSVLIGRPHARNVE